MGADGGAREAVPELPDGVVTFLFTDVAGSTGLWEQAPELMGPAMARHDVLVEAAVTSRAGVLVRPRGEGDSRFAVFPRASDAVAAALELQRALGDEPWRTPRRVAVRAALHTGEGEVRDGDYYGRSVNRCARLRGLGHPGQVLLSAATAELVRDVLPPGAGLLDLGQHALPDLLRPETVFQLVVPGQPAFPPLRSVDRQRLELRVLGRVAAARGGTALPLGGAARRGVLALLAAEAGQVVPVDRLLRAGWGTAGSPAALRAQVAALRQLLQPQGGRTTVLVAERPGYRLHLPPGTVDLQRFEALVADAAKELADGRYVPAARGLRDALTLWQGEPFEGTLLAGSPEADPLAELRLAALEDLYEAELGCGRHSVLVRPLRALLEQHPARPRLWGLLVLALHRAGAHERALVTIEDAGHALPDGPGPELLDLRRRVQRLDPSLGGPPGAVRPRLALPVPPGPLVGRRDQVQAVQARLREPGVRLLTLTGPGGAGKTRLALEVAALSAAEHVGGVFFVPLAGVTDPALVLPAVAGVLQVPSAPEEPLAEALALSVGSAPVLLVLDNLEQLTGAADVVGDLLAAVPSLRVLATSRTALRLRAEREHAVPPLGLPSSEPGGDLLAAAQESGAVQLFVARAQAVRPDFALSVDTVADVTEICRRLDGLPLGLELAAARVALLTPHELAARLGSQLRLLVGGPRDLPDRQRTLRATIDWSHALLEPGPQRLLAQLGVLAGEFDLASAEAVGDPEADVLGDLGVLVGSSLVHRVVRGDASRFRLLESVRQYALEHLRTSGDEASARRRLGDELAALVERAGPELEGPDAARVLADLRERAPDLDGALHHAVATDSGLAARLAAGLRVWWLLEGRLSEGRAWSARVLALDLSAVQRSRVLLTAGVLAYVQDDVAVAGPLLEQARQLAVDAGEQAVGTTVLGYLGAVRLSAGQTQPAQEMADAALAAAVRLGLYEAHALALSLHAVVAALRDDLAAERELYERRLALVRGRSDCRRIAETLNNLAEIALLEGDQLRARTCAEEALDLATGVARLVTRDVLLTLARVELADGARGRAAGHVEQALRLSVELGQGFEVARCLLVVAAVTGEGGDPPGGDAQTGDAETAAELHGAGARLWGDTSPVQLDLEPDLARGRDRVRAGLGPEAFDRAFARGVALATEQAVERALGAVLAVS